jgi:hypothetical protein
MVSLMLLIVMVDIVENEIQVKMLMVMYEDMDVVDNH